MANEFAIAARLYAETVVALARSGISRDEYVRLCKITEAAHKRSEAACVAFEEHVDGHRCFEGSPPILSIITRNHMH